jgi:hypothetical protein
MMTTARRIAIIICAPLAFVSAAFQSSPVVYERIAPTELRTGVVAVGTALEVMLEVPADCSGRPRSCLETRRFPVLYGLDFRLERRDVDAGVTGIVTEDRGRVYLALEMEPAEARTFDEDLRRILSGLSSDAFAEDFAGLRTGDPPFSSIAGWSVKPSWACFENLESRRIVQFSKEVKQQPDGKVEATATYTFTMGTGEFVGRVCDDMAKAMSGTAPEELRTMPVPHVVREQRVTATIASRLTAEAYPEQLVPLPPGATFIKGPGSGTGESLSSAAATLTENGIEYAAGVRPASLPPASASGTAWLSRWTMETVEKHLGALPTTKVLDRTSLMVALLPTLPPSEIDENGNSRERQPRQAYIAAINQEAFLEEIARRLDRQATLDGPTLEKAITYRPSGFLSEGWILVVCRPDGSADFWLAPTQARAAVENAALFCAAVDSGLE